MTHHVTASALRLLVPATHAGLTLSLLSAYMLSVYILIIFYSVGGVTDFKSLRLHRFKRRRRPSKRCLGLRV